MTKRFAMIAALMTTVTAASAKETYICDFNHRTGGGYLSPRMALQIDSDANKAWVVDGMTQRETKDWFETKITANNDKRFSTEWQISFRNSHGQRAILLYKLSYWKRNNRAEASMIPSAYDDLFRVNGRCERVE